MDQATAPRTVSGEELLGGQWTTEKRKRKPKKPRKGNARLWVVLLVLAVVAAVGGYWWTQQVSDLAKAMKNAGFTNVTVVDGGHGPNAIDSATACGQTFVFVQREIAGGKSIMTLATVQDDGSLSYQVKACNQPG